MKEAFVMPKQSDRQVATSDPTTMGARPTAPAAKARARYREISGAGPHRSDQIRQCFTRPAVVRQTP
jgi:hypothetical protein